MLADERTSYIVFVSGTEGTSTCAKALGVDIINLTSCGKSLGLVIAEHLGVADRYNPSGVLIGGEVLTAIV